jgi:multisubunit Na+/H+ antiporter MnhF subunit
MVATVAKYIGTYLSFYYFYKKNHAQAKYAGLTHNHQLTFGIAISMDAYQKNLISSNILSIILLIVLLSSIASIIFCNRKKAF